VHYYYYLLIISAVHGLKVDVVAISMVLIIKIYH